MNSAIRDFTITRYEWKRDRPIGDSQVRSEWHHAGTLELHSTSGHTGVGFFGALFYPLPPLTELERQFRRETWAGVEGQNPHAVTHRMSRPRGGNIGRGGIFGTAINQAMWDLAAKELDMSLARLLGGTRDRVRAYASGLDFHMTTEEVCAFFADKAQRGFSAFKIKVGHPDMQWDIARIRAISGAVGPGATLMLDANEAWSPKEAIRRAHAYRDAGFDIYWYEDPCLRDDFEGLAKVCAAVPFAHINSGEYLDTHGKRQLMEHRAVDMLNVHGGINETLHAAWLAGEYGIPVTLGNTAHEIGVHLAAAIPEAIYMEMSFHNYDHMIAEPVQFENGYAIVPTRPGHGLEISEIARTEYAKPEPVESNE